MRPTLERQFQPLVLDAQLFLGLLALGGVGHDADQPHVPGRPRPRATTRPRPDSHSCVPSGRTMR